MSWQARRHRVSVLADMALKQERVAQRLAELRERHALSQERAAQKVGITHRQWQRWENGQSMPRPGNLGEVALAFGVPVSTFYEEEPAPDPTQLDRIEQMLADVLRALSEESRAGALAGLRGAVAALDERVRLLQAEQMTAAQEERQRSEEVLAAIRRPPQGRRPGAPS